MPRNHNYNLAVKHHAVTRRKKSFLRNPIDPKAYAKWIETQTLTLLCAAESGGWLLERKYESEPGGSRYLWFERQDRLVKIRLSNHNINFAQRHEPKRPFRVSSWSINMVFGGSWRRSFEEACRKLKTYESVACVSLRGSNAHIGLRGGL